MFSLNENNRIVMARYPCDMRMGVDAMCGQVRMVGLNPACGDVYIFVGKSRKVMKILHWERGGYTMYYKRLEQGVFIPTSSCVRASVSGRCDGMSWCFDGGDIA